MNNELLEKLKAYLNKAKGAAGKVSKKAWILMAVAIVLVAAGITFYLNTRPYSVLITGANTDEMSTVLTWLTSQGVTNYRVEGENTIKVPEAVAPNLKARLLMEVTSQQNSGFEGFFESISALSTQSEINIAKNYYLQEEMRKVIRTFDGVLDASVTIETGEDLNYVLDSSRIIKASAAVKVTMQNGRLLTADQARAIRTYVASGVKGLDVDSVSLMDSRGNTYNTIDGSSYISTSALKAQMEESYSNKANNQIHNLLDSVYGPGNYTVAVNTVVSVNNQVIDEHKVNIPDYVLGREYGEGIIGDRVYQYMWLLPGETMPGGIVGTTTNSDISIPTYVENPDIDPNGNYRQYGDGQLHYDNDYTNTHTVVTSGVLEDITASVIVNTTTAGLVDKPLLRQQIAAAVGITPIVTETMTADEYLETKIAVSGMPFYVEPVEPTPGPDPNGQDFIHGIPNWVIYAAAAGVLLFILVLILILVLGARRRKKREQEEAEAAALAEQESMEQLLASMNAAAGSEPMGADVMSLQSEKSMELRQDIRRFAEENPEVAARLVAAWLKGGDSDG